MKNIPTIILNKFIQNTKNLEFGHVCLKFETKNGKDRYLITREESILIQDDKDVTEQIKETA